MRQRVVPQLFKELKDYNRETFFKDLIAGIIVGVVALPLAIAFGIASGVTPAEGLITAIIGGFLVSFLGGSKVQIGGPTGAFIVIVFDIIQKHGIDGLALATLMAGVMLLLLGTLRLGSLIKFVPYPIIVGFTAGIAVTIFTTQIKDLFGLTVSHLPSDFLGKWGAYIDAFSTMSWVALPFGLAAIAMIVLLPRLNKNLPSSLIALILLTLVSVLLGHLGLIRPENIGDRYTIEAGLPRLVLPIVTIERLQQLLPAAFTITMLGAIESLLSASVADGVIGSKCDSNMELIGQGVANFVVPFFGGIPVTGAIARTMTNINSGGRTPVAGIIHAIVLLLILLFLSPLTSHIPMAVLAGVLVVVSYNMSGWRSFIAIFKGPKGDSLVMVITFLLTVLIDLTVAIGIGMVLAILILLKRVLNTSEINLLDGKNMHPEEPRFNLPKCIEVYEIDGPFFFGIANRFDETMRAMADNPRARIIRMRNVPFVDTTALHNLKTMIELHKESNTQIILSGVQPSVIAALRTSGLVDLIGEDNVTTHISLATERALNFLQENYPKDYEKWSKKHEDR